MTKKINYAYISFRERQLVSQIYNVYVSSEHNFMSLYIKLLSIKFKKLFELQYL